MEIRWASRWPTSCPVLFLLSFTPPHQWSVSQQPKLKRFPCLWFSLLSGKQAKMLEEREGVRRSELLGLIASVKSEISEGPPWNWEIQQSSISHPQIWIAHSHVEWVLKLDYQWHCRRQWSQMDAPVSKASITSQNSALPVLSKTKAEVK